ncbi:MFS transporter [Pseudonocardia sp. MCCB 268]|nr:MFS transporter [Pseudonocardia cytotoxica]
MLVARALQRRRSEVIALRMSLIPDVLPAGQVGSGVGLMSSSLRVGGAAGPPLADLVAEHASWRLLFAAVAAGALALVVLVPRLVPESRVRTGRFDTVGALAPECRARPALLWGSRRAVSGAWASTATLRIARCRGRRARALGPLRARGPARS